MFIGFRSRGTGSTAEKSTTQGSLGDWHELLLLRSSRLVTLAAASVTWTLNFSSVSTRARAQHPTFHGPVGAGTGSFPSGSQYVSEYWMWRLTIAVAKVSLAAMGIGRTRVQAHV